MDPPNVADPSPIRVLCVDDAPGVAELTATMLEEDGEVSATAVTDPVAALERLERDAVDCIVSAHDMASIDGLRLLELVRADQPGLPFVLYTAAGSERLASDATAAGVSEYVRTVETPDGYSLLATRVRAAVERHRAADDGHHVADSVGEDAGNTHRQSRAVLETAPDAIVVSVDGTLVYANHAAVELFDGEPGDLLGVELGALASREGALAALATVESPGRHANPVHRDSETVTTGDGEDRTVELTARRIDWGGDDGVVVVLRDVTDRGRRERGREGRRHQLVDILDAVEAAVFVKDTEGRYLLMNRSCRGLFGLDPDADVVGLTDRELFPPEVAAQFRSDDRQALERGETVVLEETVPTPHGERVHLTRKTPLFDEDGEPYALCAVSTDITERKAQERQLRERIKELSTIHDIIQHFPEGEQPLDAFLRDVVEMLPGTFQRPERTGARITYGTESIQTARFEPDAHCLDGRTETADGTVVTVEVVTLDADTDAGETFLDEERELVQTLTRLVAGYVERREYVTSLERNEAVLTALGDPVYALDADGRFTYLNDALVELTGYDRGELLGEPIAKLLPADDYECGQASVERLVRDGHGETVRVELDMVTVDGERIPTETQIALLPPDEEGRFRGTVGVARDVSERKRHERDRRRQRDFLLRTEELASVGGWEYAFDEGRFEWTNGARELHGVGSEFEPTFDSLGEFYPRPDLNALANAVETCRREGGAFDLELRLITAQGRDCWVNVRGERVEGIDGELIRGTIQDVTDTKEREQQLMVLNRVLRHNLRNSLNVVTSNVELVRETLEERREDGVRKDDALAEVLDQLDSVEEHALELIGLSEKARRLAETIEGIDAAAPVEIPALLGEIAAKYRSRHPEATIALDVEELVTLSNADAIQVVVDELLDNALRHADRPDPVVTLEATTVSTGWVVLRIADDGPGIPEMEREALELGQETALEHGSGLGLWTVNWLVTRLGGTVSIRENEPRGTVVEIELLRTGG